MIARALTKDEVRPSKGRQKKSSLFLARTIPYEDKYIDLSTGEAVHFPRVDVDWFIDRRWNRCSI